VLWFTVLRRSVACSALAAFVLLTCLHLTLRPRPWIHEWYWTVDAYHFVTILLAPLVAGIAAWDGARWAGGTDTVVTSNGLGRAFRSSWIPSAVFGSAAYIAGLVAASTITKVRGTPGWPGLAVIASVLPPLALIVACSVVGAAVGWVAKRAIIGPVVAVGVFALLLVGYTTMPESLLRIGGATASLLALTPRTSIQVLQSALYLACAVTATAAVVAKVDRLPRGRTLSTAAAATVAVALTGALTSLGGMRFAEAAVDVRCAGADPTVCLSPSYEHLRADIDAVVAEPFREFAAAGFAFPVRLTQDFTAPAAEGTAILPSRPIDLYDVEMMLVFSIVPSDCDIFRDPPTYRRYSDVAYWVESLLGIAVPGDPTVAAAVADGDTAEAREYVQRIERELATCGP
jgi:hypothetical protein